MKNKPIVSTYLKISLICIIVITGLSCKKFVDINPPNTIVTGESVFNNDETAIAAITAIYTQMSNISYTQYGLTSISRLAGLSADELSLWDQSSNNVLLAYYRNELSSSLASNFGSEIWPYGYIFTCNSAIEGLSKSTSLTTNVKQQLLGEAMFIRAFCYFYLVNLYGDVPLALTSDFEVNRSLHRAPHGEVYQQIISDLTSAKGLLLDDYLDATLLNSTPERIRPNKWAAIALLARVYLYNRDWANAEAEATAVINKTSLYETVALANVFLKNSKEAIWQLQPVISGWNTEDAKALIIPSTGLSGNNPYFLNNNLLNAFNSMDSRKAEWLSSYTDSTGTYFYPYKYKSAVNGNPVTEYLMILRLGEQYLIRAEARAMLNKINESQADLNLIRTRAGLSNTTASTKSELLDSILHERQVELFTEWGHRWLDVKRTNNVDAIMTTVTSQKANGLPWLSFQQLYPLPWSDLQKDPNLVQNTGY